MLKPKGPGVARIPRSEEQLSARGRGARFTPAEMLSPLAAYKNIFGEYPKLGRCGGYRADHAEAAWSHGIRLNHPSSLLRRFGGYHAACVAADYWFSTGPSLDVEDLAKERTKETLIHELALVFLAVGNGPVRDDGPRWHPHVAEGADRIGLNLACPRIYVTRLGGLREATEQALAVARQLQADDWDALGHVDLSHKQKFSPHTRRGLIDILKRIIEAVGVESILTHKHPTGWHPVMAEAAEKISLRLPTPATYRRHFGTIAEARRVAQEEL